MPRGRKKATPEPSPAAPASGSNGAEPQPKARPQPRRLGIQAALNRAADWRRAHSPLSADQDALLGISARLYCHGLNLSSKLFAEGETKADGDVKVAMKTLLDIDERLASNLRELFPDDGDGGDLSRLFGRGKG